MSSYEVELYWSGPASDVIVTGTFDNWAESIHLTKTASGKFIAKVLVPYGTKVDYKYIVDGQWLVNQDFPTTWDTRGNINNYIMTPPAPKPAPAPAAAPKPAPAPAVALAPAVPEPTLALAVETATPKATEKETEPEPVTPVNVPASATAAVTPMAVPDSAIAPHPDLDVDPTVSRSVVSAIMEVVNGGPGPAEAEEVATKEAAKEELKIEAVVLASAPILESPQPVPVKGTAEKEIYMAEEPSKAEAVKLTETRTASKAEPELAVSISALEIAPANVALDTPVKAPSTPPPATPAPAEPVTPAAVPIPSTPGVNGTHSVEKSETNGVSPSAFSTASTTSTPTKAGERPTLGGSVKKTGSVRSSRIFSFPGRKNSHGSEGPSSPSASLKRDESTRKKKTSILDKVHDIFHPHHKREAASK